MQMRAKFQVTSVSSHPSAEAPTQQTVAMTAVGPSASYPADGSDEDNSYARWTPNASVSITIQNPALFGQFAVGDKLYADFTKAE